MEENKEMLTLLFTAKFKKVKEKYPQRVFFLIEI